MFIFRKGDIWSIVKTRWCRKLNNSGSVYLLVGLLIHILFFFFIRSPAEVVTKMRIWGGLPINSNHSFTVSSVFLIKAFDVVVRYHSYFFIWEFFSNTFRKCVKPAGDIFFFRTWPLWVFFTIKCSSKIRTAIWNFLYKSSYSFL